MAMQQSKNTVSPQNIVMGFQHMFVMFGATVLVPIMTGLDISVALFASGVGTLLFHVVTKFKVPVYLGSSFAFIPVIIAVSTAEGGARKKLVGSLWQVFSISLWRLFFNLSNLRRFIPFFRRM